MPRIEKKVETYWDSELCECGGAFSKRIGKVVFMTDPVQADFQCDKCGAQKTLSEDKFPGVKHRFFE